MIEYATAQEARIEHPHTMLSGAYFCPMAGQPWTRNERDHTRYAVLLRRDGRYACPVCHEIVQVPTCGKDGE